MSSQNLRLPPASNLPALTGLRGIAAVWVMLFHLLYSRGIPVIDFGCAGVDVFFLLSGFILAHVYLRDPGLTTVEGYLRFLGVRLARIYPLHLFTLLCLLLITIVLPGFTAPFKLSEIRFDTETFIANPFLVQHWGLCVYGSWNSPSWSLSAEWMAYLIFPFLLLPLRRISSRHLLARLAATLLAGMIILLYTRGYRSLDAGDRAGLVRMAGEFTAGCLLNAAFALGWRIPPIPSLLLILGLLGGGMLLPLCGLVMVFAFPLMVILAAQRRNGFARLLEWRPVLFLGDISFSLYMVHVTVIWVFNWLGRQGFPRDTVAADALIFVIVLVLAIATYHFIEIPARRWGRRLALGERTAYGKPVAVIPN